MPVAGKFHLLSLSRCMVHIRKAITRRKPGHGCSNSLALGHGGPMGVSIAILPQEIVFGVLQCVGICSISGAVLSRSPAVN